MCLRCPRSMCNCCGGFDPLREEIGRFRDFNTLIDSGIIGRVRELKQWLDASFYHPGVLATVSAYNATFGKKFDELFAKALTEIKTFGQALEEMGGTILTTVDGVEVTVDHVAAIEEKQLLDADYGSTFEKFRRVSKLKKELDRRPPIRRSLLSPAGQTSRAGGQCSGGGSESGQSCGGEGSGSCAGFSAARGHGAAAFGGGKRNCGGSRNRFGCSCAWPIRNIARLCPMRFFNLTLTTAEADAYSASFLEEKSLRADVARTLIRMVSVSATHQHGTRRIEAQPEDVIAVEASRGFGGRAARHG